MEKITFWQDDKLVTKKLSSKQEIEYYVSKNGIEQYYWCDLCFLRIGG